MDIETIAVAVSAEWQIGFGGIEWDFALEVAKRAASAEREACAVLCERSDRYRGEYFAAKIRERSNIELKGGAV